MIQLKILKKLFLFSIVVFSSQQFDLIPSNAYSMQQSGVLKILSILEEIKSSKQKQKQKSMRLDVLQQMFNDLILNKNIEGVKNILHHSFPHFSEHGKDKKNVMTDNEFDDTKKETQTTLGLNIPADILPNYIKKLFQFIIEKVIKDNDEFLEIRYSDGNQLILRIKLSQVVSAKDTQNWKLEYLTSTNNKNPRESLTGQDLLNSGVFVIYLNFDEEDGLNIIPADDKKIPDGNSGSFYVEMK